MTDNKAKTQADDAETPADAPKTTEQIAPDEAAEAEALESVAAPNGAASAETGDGDLRVLEAELAETKDRLMRAAADLQNMRKRAERDRRDAEVYGGTKLARDLLPVYDNLKQAVALASDELREKEAGFFNGVDLTLKELTNGFAKHKITPIEPEKGEKFDPHKHQAMFEAPVPGAEAGSVIEVMAVGFMIADKLLRPAMVGVAKGGVAEAPKDDAAASGDTADSEAG